MKSKPILIRPTFSFQLYLFLLKIVGRLKLINNLLSGNHQIVICYQHIGEGNWKFGLSESQFSQQIQYLAENFKVVSLAEIVNPRKPKNSPLQVAITFDDGYHCVYQKAYPILKKYSMPGTIFVLGEPKKADRAELSLPCSFLSLEQMDHLRRAGWEIGFHTQTHTDLLKLNQPQLNREIIDGKKNFENKSNFKIRFLSYPKGRYNRQIIDTVKKAGFKAAFTAEGGQASLNNPYSISRITVPKHMTVEYLPYLLTPTGMLINRLFSQFWQIKDRL